MFKKILFSLMLCTLFISCGKSFQKDDYGCFMNYDDAVSYATSKKLPVLVIFTSDGDDDASSSLVSQVIKSAAFASEILPAYSVYHADFSGDFFAKTNVADNATAKEVELANLYTNIIQTNYQYAMLFGVDTMPAVFLCTKEGYVITAIDDEDSYESVQSFKAMLSEYSQDLADFNEMVAQTKKGNAMAKVEAIDAIYRTNNPQYKSFLAPLAQQVIELDKNNKSGLLGKYIVSNADAQALSAYSKGDVETAVKYYLEAADSEFVKAEDKQECVYTAAYLVAYSGSEDYEGILVYLKAAYEIAPESAKANAIQEAINYFELIVDNADDLSALEDSQAMVE